MKFTAKQITESLLRTSLQELATNFAKELALACRKVAIYGHQHQVARQSVDRFFDSLQVLFSYRRSVPVFVVRGNVSICSIQLGNSTFTDQLLQYFSNLQINSLIIDPGTSRLQCLEFIEMLVRRSALHDDRYNFATELISKSLHSFSVNTERGQMFGERRRLYRGNLEGDFTVKRLAMDQIGRDPLRWAALRSVSASALESLGVDFVPEIVSYLLPECVAGADEDLLISALANVSSPTYVSPFENCTGEQLRSSLSSLVTYHPAKNFIFSEINSRQAIHELESGKLSQQDNSGKVQIDMFGRLQSMLDAALIGSAPESTQHFGDLFERLLRTAQLTDASTIVSRLLSGLLVTESNQRQHALTILKECIERLDPAIHTPVMSPLIGNIRDVVQQHKETFEYSALIPALFDRCTRPFHLSSLAEIAWIFASRRHTGDSVQIYDSAAIKAAYDQIDQARYIEPLAKLLTTATSEDAQCVRQILTAIGSELVAASLSGLISHPVRNVRNQVLKVLCELERPSVIVFSRILNNPALFRRAAGSTQLPDQQWFIARNSIYVLGSLRSTACLAALQPLVTDLDPRVRREVVSALKKIGGEEALDMIGLMLSDTTTDIREAAFIALGLAGREEMALVILDALKSSHEGALKGLAALGRVGGPNASTYLIRLLTDNGECARLSGGKFSKDEVRAAAVRALGVIGGEAAKTALRKLDSASALSSLFRSSTLSQALSEVLPRK